MKIGIIGAGFIGRAAASVFTNAGYEVMVSNTRGLRSLHTVVNTIGCKGGTIEEAIAFSDTILLAIPFYAYETLPKTLLAGKTVMDAGNYYSDRDGANAELDAHSTTTSEILARLIPESSIVKVFNAITASDIERDGKPESTSGRRALPIAGDDANAKQTVSGLLDAIGFDTLDAGPLSEGWRFEEGTPVYCIPNSMASLREGLASARMM